MSECGQGAGEKHKVRSAPANGNAEALQKTEANVQQWMGAEGCRFCRDK